MPTWLSDPSSGLYTGLTVIFVITVGAWFRSSQTRRVHFTVGGILLAILSIPIVDYLVESPREEAVRRLGEMATAANAHQWDAVFANISDQFRYHSSDKAAFRSVVVPNAERHGATIHFKSFDRENVEMLAEDRIRIGCIAQVSTPAVDVVPYYVEAEFGNESDGTWRMRGFQVYNIAQRKRAGEERVPGLP
ncbi:MAG: hypothetical protein LC104_06335 [Bacteroidales bacterium]|nr:hypothetical protein [Bacteroidales bacterium]